MKLNILFTLIMVCMIIQNDAKAQLSHPPSKAIRQIQQLEASEDFSFLRRQDNTLWATGNNANGQLGDGTFIDKHQFEKVMKDVRTVSIGKVHTLILKTDNTLWVTGDNEDGQIGLDTLSKTCHPIKLMDNVKECVALDFCSYILDKSGNLYITGSESLEHEPYFKPHLLLKNQHSIPEKYYDIKFRGQELKNLKLPQDTEWAATYGRITMLLKNEHHTLWSNFLDNGSLFVISPPQNEEKVARRDLNHFQQITDQVYTFALGDTYALIYKYDGTLWVLGRNHKGQLGDGTTNDHVQLKEIKIP